MILSELKSFAEVMVTKTEISLNREILVSGESQVESQEKSNINAMTMNMMNIETKIEINTKKMISDMICLFDGRVIVVEMGDYVNILTRDGKLQKQLPISGVPLSVTQINQDTIAITYPHEKVIHIFNMKNGTIISSIRLNKKCWGLSYSNNFLAVGLSNDDGIRIIDLDGNTLTSTQVQSKSKLYHLVYCNDRVIYSDFYGNAVSCINESGNQIWQYKHDLSGPEGLCTDNYGNIIVTDYSSDRIIVISKDGQDGKVLIRKEHGLAHPKCICFKNIESYGFICDNMGILLAKFNLSFK
ncbi:unnamed protein product [Mytilus coruscus]|uniref:TRIM2_3 n=1 Tax=Mytilus coruscus TaxID=42192 RepID=A0A6J8D4C2_MYTCO|nr:unnamed protein product [Mytilus coruscus]